MKKDTSWILWIISPTYKLAERNKRKLLDEPDGKRRVTQGIKNYNGYYLKTTIGLAVLAHFVVRQENYQHEHWKYINLAICVLFGWLIFFSRAFEIFKAFMDDAVEKLNKKPSVSELDFGDRLRLALNSYIELMVGFGVFYYTLPSSFFKSGVEKFQFRDIIEAVYFSGVTMTTVGYGDVSPAHWLTQCLVVFQVFCGLTLALVCFTVYTTLALSNPGKSDN